MSQQPAPDGTITPTPTALPGQQVVVTPQPAPASGVAQEMFPRSYVDEIRQSDAKHRVAAREARERAEAAEKEIERLKPLEGQIKTLKVDAALSEIIASAGVDAKLTRALLRDEIGALDPSADTFKASLQSLVDKAAKETPALKVATTTGSSGATKAGSDITHPNTTTPLANDQWTREQLLAAKKAGKVQEIAQALKDGKLKAIMGAQ